MRHKSLRVGILALILLSFLSVPVSAYQYSITNVEWYDNSEDLYPFGTGVANAVKNRLNGAGWSQRFYETDYNVDDYDFGYSQSGYQGLDEAEFHYHFGHGINVLGETHIEYSRFPNGDLVRGEVYKKWDSVNKWVVIDACHILANLQWGGALKYSHGILGFSTLEAAYTELPDKFLRNCIDYDYTIGYAWQQATQEVFGSDVTARVIFDTQTQLLNDHLSGQGYVAPNENPDDDVIYYDSWTC